MCILPIYQYLFLCLFFKCIIIVIYIYDLQIMGVMGFTSLLGSGTLGQAFRISNLRHRLGPGWGSHGCGGKPPWWSQRSKDPEKPQEQLESKKPLGRLTEVWEILTDKHRCCPMSSQVNSICWDPWLAEPNLTNILDAWTEQNVFQGDDAWEEQPKSSLRCIFFIHCRPKVEVFTL